MIIRALFFLLGFAVGIAEGRGDEPPGTRVSGRIVEGRIAAPGGRPIEGARVLFGRAGRGTALVEGATATTDARGRYRADMVRFPWTTATVRVLVLAPGFKARDGKIEAGTTTPKADFELVAEPWKETLVRLQDHSGKPVAGAEITCSIGCVIPANNLAGRSLDSSTQVRARKPAPACLAPSCSDIAIARSGMFNGHSGTSVTEHGTEKVRPAVRR